MDIYVLEYMYRGKTHNLRIEADSWNDAEDLVQEMCETLEVSGKIVEEWPA